MKVLLAYRAPDESADDPEGATLPSGLRSLAAALGADGHEASVANLSRLSWKQVEKFLSEARPALVGVSCFTFNRHPAVRLARLVRRACPGASVILGGPHASALPGLLLGRIREIDAVAIGEAEDALVSAARRIAAGESLDGVAGLATRGAPASPARLVPADSLRFGVAGLQGAGLDPSRDLAHVLASLRRGSEPARRSPERVAAEIGELREEFGLLELALVGPGLANARWLLGLTDSLLAGPHAVSWEMEADPGAIAASAEEETLERALHAARGAGLRAVRFVLDDSAAASIPSDDLAAIARTLRSAGVASSLTLRIGGLGESLGARWLDSMRAVVRTLRPASGSIEARELLPGTGDWAVAAQDEGLDETYWLDEDRPFIPLAHESALDRATAALEVVFREVAREGQLGPRDLDSLEARGASARTHLDWGDFRAAHGDPEEAERRFRLAAQLEPWSPFPWLRLAALFRRGRGSDEREAAALQQVVQRVPRHAASRDRIEELRRAAARRGGRSR